MKKHTKKLIYNNIKHKQFDLCAMLWQGLKDSNRTLTDTKNAKWEFTYIMKEFKS